MMNFHPTLILASKSPRRQQLLKEAGFKFSIKIMEVEESYPPQLPANEVAKYLAQKKASAFKDELTEEVVLTADTVVVFENEILGKPKDRDHARSMLEKLSGSIHHVITGVCLLSRDKEICFDDITEVHFKSLSIEEINYYIENYQPFDKAGAYGIQEWIGMVGINKIVGSHFNVMGLPLHKIYEALKAF